MTTDTGWRLPLSSAAKAIITVIVVVGAIAFGASIIANSVNGSNTVNNTSELIQVQQAIKS